LESHFLIIHFEIFSINYSGLLPIALFPSIYIHVCVYMYMCVSITVVRAAIDEYIHKKRRLGDKERVIYKWACTNQ